MKILPRFYFVAALVVSFFLLGGAIFFDHFNVAQAASFIRSLNSQVGTDQFFANDTNITITSANNVHTLGWSGVLQPPRGGTGTSNSFTAGSIVFAGAGGVYSESNADLFWDSTNRRLGVGTSQPLSKLNVVQADTAVTDLRMGYPFDIYRANNLDLSGFKIVSKRARGSLTNPTIVTNGDGILSLEGRAHDNVGYQPVAKIDFEIDTTPSQDNIPGRISFSTSGGGPTLNTYRERMRITSGGRVGIGTNSPIGDLHVFNDTNTTVYIGNSGVSTGCLVMSDSDGNGVTYVYADDGVLYSTSTKPLICR